MRILGFSVDSPPVIASEPMPTGASWSPMQTPSDIPYWLRSIGRHLRSHCGAERQLPFNVKLNLLSLIRVEGAMGLLRTYPGLF
jgi:hypothetical protein